MSSGVDPVFGWRILYIPHPINRQPTLPLPRDVLHDRPLVNEETLVDTEKHRPLN